MQPANANTLRPPRSRQLRLDLLHTFEAAARHLSFTRAGAELALSQSAVSRQVQQLEDSVGAALFERRHRALALTDAGRILQRAVEDSLERLRDAAARVRSSAEREQLAVTCTPGFASFWLIPRLARFTAVHPDVDVRISATLELVDLERRGVDLAVRFVPAAQGQGPLLFEEEVQPMCAPALLRDAKRPLAAPADLARHTLLAVEMHDAPLTAEWEPWLQLMGLAAVPMAHTLRFTRYGEAVAAAVAGQGVVIGRLPLLADLVRTKKLVAPFRSPAASRRAYFVTLAPHETRHPSARAFADWLVEEARLADGASGGRRRAALR
ncbi:MAG TPA: LysR substrate-binding domain-containing protein [Ramlibacter sp.]|uniref:LysR substrate-binding domain-containing protein n=1 Tax=Ramlibacter sp. TaxID=1917967 RepID=UPI002D7F7271|nr:LysR substrate-binding domain-containing protein [Ramlibacter sp.]HET8747552.1 LysR substrate-binding domain-containing protein [Ramlibacter sp.]